MKRSIAVGVFSLAVLGVCAVSAAVAQETAPPVIAAIRAQLYYEETGAFSDDILDRGELALWNTVIGEGDARHASNSTLVTDRKSVGRERV